MPVVVLLNILGSHMKSSLVLCALLNTCLLQPVLAQFSIYGSFLDDRTVLPGTTYDGSLTVVNESDVTAHVVLSLDSPGDTERRGRSNASWITFYPESFEIEAGTKRDVFYTVNVPALQKSQPLSGSYWSTLLIEEDQGSRTHQGNGGHLRYEVLLVTHIHSSGRTALEIRGVYVIEEKGLGLFVEAHVENTGDTMLKPEGWLELYNEAGSMVGRIPVDKIRMYPGKTIVQRVNVQGIAPGKYEALLVLDAGDNNIFGGQYSIQLATDKAASGGPVH